MKKECRLGICILLLILPHFVAADTASNKDKGAATKAQTSHELSHFTSIVLTGVGELYIKQSQQESLTIEAIDAIRPLIEVSVKDKTLFINLQKASEHQDANIKYYLNIKDLQNITVNGTGSIFIPDGIDTKILNLSVSDLGAAKVIINVKKLIAKIESGGKIDAEGIAETQEISIRGAGEFKGNKLSGQTVTLAIDGLGLAKIYPTGTLNVRVSEDGQAMYCGKPVVNKDIASKGRVVPLAPSDCK